MSENTLNKDFIQRLLEDRDAEYRRAVKAEQQVSELSDVAKLKAGYEQIISEKESTINQQAKTITEKDNKIASLMSQLDYLKRKMWGAMSEKRHIPDDPSQLKLDFDQQYLTPEQKSELDDVVKEIAESKTVKVKEYEKKVPVRKPLPESLRRVENHIYPEGYLGHEDEWILFEDTEISEHLELVPAEFYVRVTIRHKGMKKDTKEIVTAPAPVEPIAKSYATPSLLADLIVGKYVDHLPFYRQIQIYKRLGVSLPPATIESWFHETADLLRPLYYRLKEKILACDYVQADETTIPIINDEKHKTVKGYLWLVRDVMNGLVFFHYDKGSRSEKVAYELFRNFKGCIQTDGYDGYNIVAKQTGVIAIGCMAHSRRYFDRAKDNDQARVNYALSQFGLVYDVEDIATAKNMTYDERKELRTRMAYPILKAFEIWCNEELPKVMPKSPIGKALSYFSKRARQLARYTMDGRYQIDNNLIENSVRPVALGRKNYLFCGNHDSAEDAAVIYSLMGCCKAADVDFKKWAEYFFSHIHEYDEDYSKDLADFLPATLKERQLI
jgi:transposase